MNHYDVLIIGSGFGGSVSALRLTEKGYRVDGSTVSVNLGVNLSPTITAQAERAMSMWPDHGESDARPGLGLPYQRVGAVAPKSPVVPETGSGALRLSVLKGTS